MTAGGTATAEATNRQVLPASTVRMSDFDSWYANSGAGDSFVWASSGHYLPRNCPVRDLVQQLSTAGRLHHGGQRKQADGTYHWIVKRSGMAKPGKRRIGLRSVDEERLFQILEAAAARDLAMPDVRELAREACIPRHDVLTVLQSLETAGEVSFETWWNSMSKSWRVATIIESGMRTRMPPKNAGWSTVQKRGRT